MHVASLLMAKSMTKKNGISRKVIKLRLKQKAGNNGTKSKTSTLALAQGVGQVNRKPFQTKSKQNLRRITDYFNATLPPHLPLPRSVGPYTIIRTTQVVQTSAELSFFAFIASEAPDATVSPQWLAACGVSDEIMGPVNDPGATRLHPMVGLDALLTSAVVSPAALTVQIMNPSALLNTSGIAYLGRSSAQYELRNSSRTWNDLGNEFVQFMAPRLCSAGKLALRGVTIDSYPLDMSEISNFRSIRPFGTIGPTLQWISDDVRPAGFAPIVCFNPNNIGLQFLVTMEWRVRFDPSNPAAGSHSYHGTAPDSLWDTVTRRAAAMGHGAEDIAEKVAEVGAVGSGIISTGAMLLG